MPILASSSYRNIYGKPDAYATIESTQAGQDAFITKYSTVGKALWSARIATYLGTTSSEVVNSVVADTSGNIYVAGTSGNASITSFYNADGTMFQTLLANAGNTDAFLAKYNRYGRVQWITRVATTGADLGLSIAIDTLGNVYATGQSTGTFTAYNADGTAFGTTFTNAGAGGDAYIAKYNTNGFVQWVARVSTTSASADIGYGIATDSSGNVYMTGAVPSGSSVLVTAYNSDGTAFGTTFTSAGSAATIVKYDTNGVVQWLTRVDSGSSDIGYGIVADSSGNVYVTGQAATGSTTITMYNADGTTFGTFGSNGADAFLAKYDTNGTGQWLTRIGAGGSQIGYAITIDSSSNVYVAGSAATATAYNSDGTTFATTLTDAGGGDAFLVKYNSSGFVQWIAKVASTGADIGYGVSIDSSGNVFITGTNAVGPVTAFSSNGTAFGTTLQNVGGNDAFLVEYNSLGTVQWLTRLGSTGADRANSVYVDSNGDVITTGFFTGGSLGIYGQGVSLFSTLPNSGGTDAFVIKYNPNGAPQWAARIASTGDDIGYAVASTSSGDIYVTGQGGSAANITAFNADGSSFATTLVNIGGNDAFLIKYDTNGVVQWVTKLASTGTDIGFGVATDAIGNVIVCGQMGSSLQFIAYNSDGSAFATTMTSSQIDGFIVKYDSSGFVQWVARISSGVADYAYAVTCDSSNNIYVGGYASFNTTTIVRAINSDGTNGPGITFSSFGYVFKYNSAGFAQWGIYYNGTTGDPVNALALDSDGNLIIGGSFSASPVLYNSDGTTFLSMTNSGNVDAVVAKYNSSGFGVWAARIAQTNSDAVNALGVDNENSVYVAGTCNSGAVAFNADGTSSIYRAAAVGGSAGFVVKYNSVGVVQWFGCVEGGAADAIYGLAVTPQGSCSVVGQFGTTASTNTSIYNGDGSLYSSASGAFTVVTYDKYGDVSWIQALRGNTTIGIGRGAAVDNSGNLYVTGSTGSAQTLQIFNTDSSLYKVLNTFGGQDSFVVKYSSNTTPLWAALISSSVTDTAYGIATDTSGNVYVTGQGGSGVTTNVYNANGTLFGILANAGLTDAFTIKYDTNGYVQWIARVAATSGDVGVSIATDSSGNIYMSGTYGNAIVTAYNSDGSVFGTVASAVFSNIFIVKYNTNGFVQWFARIASGASDYPSGIATDSSGNVYVTGEYGNGTLTVYNASGTIFNSLGATGSSATFVAKYDTTGSVQWSLRIGGGGTAGTDNGAYRITVGSDGNVYVTGRSNNTTLSIENADGTTFGTLANAGGGDVFIIKYNTNGFAQWAARIGTTGSDTGYSIATDSSGNVYVTGLYGNAACTAFNSDGTAFGTTLAAAGSGDAFLVKYNSTGFVQWVTRIASVSADVGYSVALDSAGDVYVVGSTVGLTSFYPYNADGTSFGSIIGSSKAAGTDSFIVKYNSSGVVQWMSIIAGAGTDELRGIALDPSNNMYVSGNFNASALVPTSA